ncbi:MAG: MATE family efflux transporter [Lachnospiraceae bacterium]|nr:MATE family efflux transporter [Lachnospiraceae bacterium]
MSGQNQNQNQNQKQNKMAVMPMGALMWNMSLPMMISLLVQSLYNIVDSIFVARISEQALTATSLAFPVQMLMIAVGVGTAVGLNAELSRTLGTGDKEEASRVAVTGILLEVISAAIFMILGLFGANTLAHLFTSDAQIAEQCGSYLFICMVFCLGNFVCMSYQRLMQSSGKAFLSMAILVAGAVTNLILDPILIFGMFGIPALGIRGAAIATVIGQWVSMFTGFLLQKYCNRELHVTLKNYRMKAARVGAIYKVGIPTIIMQALNSMMVTAFNAILLPFSSTAVAFFGVYYKLQNFLFMPLNGLGQASIPIVGYNFGAKNQKRIKEALKIVYPTAIVIAVVGTVLFQLFPRQLLGLFSAGESMLAIGVPALRVISISFAVASVTMITGYFLSGLGDGVTNMVGAFLRQFVPLIPAAWLFAKFGGIQAVWYAIWISEICGAVYAVARLFRKRKVLGI